ncbi:MAG: phage major capsid protein [Microbacteriaceae bacterium]|nr:phage major capsid protein [Microbacteriaceae bacterium]
MPTAAELQAQRDAKRAAAGAFLEAFKGPDGQYDMPTDKVGEFRKRNEEVDELSKLWEAAVAAERDAAIEAVRAESTGRKTITDTAADVPQRIQTKAGLDRAFRQGFDANADHLKHIAGGGRGTARFHIDADLKTVVTIGTSYATQPEQVGRAESALFFGDAEPYFPHGQTSAASVVGYIQTTDTDNAAFKAEVTAATDSAFVWTPVTDEVEDVQTWIPISRNLLSDEPAMQSVITGMLARRLQKEVSDQLLNGTGSTPVIWGVFKRTGFQTQAKGTDPTFDAIHKAITLVNVTGDASANLAVFHPNDWQDIRLTRTTDGIYILGNPTEAGPLRIWGLPVLLSTGMTENTGGVVDTSFTTLFENGGLIVEVSTEHGTYFTERTVAIAMFRRLAAFHYRPSAAATITGI